MVDTFIKDWRSTEHTATICRWHQDQRCFRHFKRQDYNSKWSQQIGGITFHQSESYYIYTDLPSKRKKMVSRLQLWIIWQWTVGRNREWVGHPLMSPSTVSTKQYLLCVRFAVHHQQYWQDKYWQGIRKSYFHSFWDQSDLSGTSVQFWVLSYTLIRTNRRRNLRMLLNLWGNEEMVKKPGKYSQVKNLNKLGFSLKGA